MWGKAPRPLSPLLKKGEREGVAPLKYSLPSLDGLGSYLLKRGSERGPPL
jgi:hypothetical protein